MLMGQAVGIGGGRRVEGIGGGGKCERNGWRGMIIGEILCLFLLQKLPILLDPLSFYPLYGRVTRKSKKQAKRNARDGILRHRNKKDLGIPKSLLF